MIIPLSWSFSSRDGEINGVHYHFVALSDMEAAIERGEFVEYAKVHMNMYGTSVKAVGDVSFFSCVDSVYHPSSIIHSSNKYIDDLYGTGYHHRYNPKARFAFWILTFKVYKKSK